MVIDRENPIYFSLEDDGPEDCEEYPSLCHSTIRYDELGIDSMPTAGPQGLNLTYYVSYFKTVGSHGFSVAFENGISSIKFYYETKEPATEMISLLNEAGQWGTGEWVQASVALWDVNFVSKKQLSKHTVLIVYFAT